MRIFKKWKKVAPSQDLSPADKDDLAVPNKLKSEDLVKQQQRKQRSSHSSFNFGKSKFLPLFTIHFFDRMSN